MQAGVNHGGHRFGVREIEKVCELREDGGGVADEGGVVDFEEADLRIAAQEVEGGGEVFVEEGDDFGGDVGVVAGVPKRMRCCERAISSSGRRMKMTL